MFTGDVKARHDKVVGPVETMVTAGRPTADSLRYAERTRDARIVDDADG